MTDLKQRLIEREERKLLLMTQLKQRIIERKKQMYSLMRKIADKRLSLMKRTQEHRLQLMEEAEEQRLSLMKETEKRRLLLTEETEKRRLLLTEDTEEQRLLLMEETEKRRLSLMKEIVKQGFSLMKETKEHRLQLMEEAEERRLQLMEEPEERRLLLTEDTEEQRLSLMKETKEQRLLFMEDTEKRRLLLTEDTKEQRLSLMKEIVKQGFSLMKETKEHRLSLMKELEELRLLLMKEPERTRSFTYESAQGSQIFTHEGVGGKQISTNKRITKEPTELIKEIDKLTKEFMELMEKLMEYASSLKQELKWLIRSLKMDLLERDFLFMSSKQCLEQRNEYTKMYGELKKDSKEFMIELDELMTGLIKGFAGLMKEFEEHKVSFMKELQDCTLLKEFEERRHMKKMKQETYEEMNFMSDDWKTTAAAAQKSSMVSSTQSWELTLEQRFHDIISRVQEPNLARNMLLWLKWVDKSFPCRYSQACFLPGIKENTAPAEGSDVRYDTAIQHVLVCLDKMSEESGEVFFCLSQFQFGQYVGKSCYAAAAAQIPESAGLSPDPPRDWKDGDMDFLLIHPRHGLVICEVKTFGDNQSKPNMTQEEVDDEIRAKLALTVSQLDRAENTLTDLVSDIAPGLRITKTIAFPDFTAHQVQQAAYGNPRLMQDLCQCLGATDPADVTSLCLFSDQLSDPQTPCDVSENVLVELGKWWNGRVARNQTEVQTYLDIYDTLVARICGPAATVIVPDGPWSQNLVEITLSPKQINLLNAAPPRVFVVGPPETGKTTTLLLMAKEWLRGGNDIIVLPSAISYSLYTMLREIVYSKLGSDPATGQIHYPWDDDFRYQKDIENAVNNLSTRGKEGLLYVIADPDIKYGDSCFCTFCDNLLKKVPRLHLWAASNYDEKIPFGWKMELLTDRFVRSVLHWKSVCHEPSSASSLENSSDVVEDIITTKPPSASTKQDEQVARTTRLPEIKTWSQSNVPRPSDGAPVRKVHELHHEGRGHTERFIKDCATCGQEVARVLYTLGVGSCNATASAAPCLHYRDVLILSRWYDVGEESGVVIGLKGAGIPVKVMKEDGSDDVAATTTDVVWLTQRNFAHDLEKKVIVYLSQDVFSMHHVPLCTSHLVVVTSTLLSTQESNLDPCNADGDYPPEETEATKEIQEGESKRRESQTKCQKDAGRDKETQENTSMTADCLSYRVQYKITVDLRDTDTATAPQYGMDQTRSASDDTDFKTWEATENKEVIAQSPIFSKCWQRWFRFYSEGASVKSQGSGVLLQVPTGAIKVHTNIDIYAAICASDTYIKQKLKLPATETVVSPLAEFWAGPDLRFQKHVHVTLPTCLSSEYDVNLVHVYCITRERSEGEINVIKLERLIALPQTADKTTPEAYFYINEKRQVNLMTTHFSGYVCTYCGLCQNIELEVYASHKHRNGSVQVSLIAYLWDKLQVLDFAQEKSEDKTYRRVLHETYQLREMFKPAQLHVELVLDEEDVTTWKFAQIPELKKTYGLNWGKITCENCAEGVVKYTELGLFRPGWKVKSEKCEENALPSTLEAHIVISHLQTGQDSMRSYTTGAFSLDVQPRTQDDTCHANDHHKFPSVVINNNVNINNVNGDLYMAEKSITQKSWDETRISDIENDEKETSLKALLQDPLGDYRDTPATQQHNSDSGQGTT